MLALDKRISRRFSINVDFAPKFEHALDAINGARLDSIFNVELEHSYRPKRSHTVGKQYQNLCPNCAYKFRTRYAGIFFTSRPSSLNANHRPLEDEKQQAPHKGLPVVYASPTQALAALESYAQLGSHTTVVRDRYWVEINVPNDLVASAIALRPDDLHPAWSGWPQNAASLGPGDAWLQSKTSALLFVPSVLVPAEFNVLINPRHPDAPRITANVTTQFLPDHRIVGTSSSH